MNFLTVVKKISMISTDFVGVSVSLPNRDLTFKVSEKLRTYQIVKKDKLVQVILIDNSK